MKFRSEFFTQLFEHFCAYLRLHSANHSDLGIDDHWKDLFLLLQKLSIDGATLIKSDDIRRGRKVKVHHGRLQVAQASMG